MNAPMYAITVEGLPFAEPVTEYCKDYIVKRLLEHELKFTVKEVRDEPNAESEQHTA